MAFHTEKDLKSKNVRGKEVYILVRDVNTENLKSKPNKFRPENGPLFGQLKSNCLDFFYKMFIYHNIITKYLISEKLAFSLHYKLRYRGAPPASFVGKRPSLLRVNGPAMKIFFCVSPSVQDFFWFITCTFKRSSLRLFRFKLINLPLFACILRIFMQKGPY